MATTPKLRLQVSNIPNEPVRLMNIAPAVNPNDAVTYQQLTDEVGGSGAVSEIPYEGMSEAFDPETYNYTGRMSAYVGPDEVRSTNVMITGNNNDSLIVGTVQSNSDIRHKEDIESIENTDDLMKLNPCTYKFKHNEKRSAGLIAQEVEEIYPDMVGTDENGFKSIDYNMLIPYMLKRIQDLTVQVQKLNE